MKRLRLALVAALPPLALLAAALEPAEAPTPSEYDVKAAYLYHFAKFVEWPADARGEAGSFVVAVLGRDPFESALDDALRGKAIDNRKVVVRRAWRVEDVGQSQILFISGSEQDRLPAILKRLESRRALSRSATWTASPSAAG